ncbi:FAD-dependent oxidoreductase [Micromonospora sp. NPDC047812]|uniref:FAD-dependent oxidoreductase n=1 Tax=Micromonospora sp. NPDC047812 TaxID=3155742 RepID=UPI003454DE68
MKRTELHIVIGGGIAGCLAAIMRRRAGYRVLLLERAEARSPEAHPICTGASNIVSENHSGAEYPFDPQSARDCFDGRLVNERFFPNLVFGGKDYSRVIASRAMQDSGTDIIGQCRDNMRVIQDRYAQRCAEDPANALFGAPEQVCREIPAPEGISDVGATFVTPQRGINPVVVTALLDQELRRCGVEVRGGAEVTEVSRRSDGTYQVEYVEDEVRKTVVGDQVSLCAATETPAMARRLNPSLALPSIYMALRQILFVDLPDGTTRDYTCLKLEDEYGGMLSPFSRNTALVYYPPAAHIAVHRVDPTTYALPEDFRHYLRNGHPEARERAELALRQLSQWYPEVRGAEVVSAHLKVAINTTDSSRLRRNAGVLDVAPGCTATVLLKWTMCVVNAQRDLEAALRHSIATGNADRDEYAELVARATVPIAPPADMAAWQRRLGVFARNMGVPERLAVPFVAAGEPDGGLARTVPSLASS